METIIQKIRREGRIGGVKLPCGESAKAARGELPADRYEALLFEKAAAKICLECRRSSCLLDESKACPRHGREMRKLQKPREDGNA